MRIGRRFGLAATATVFLLACSATTAPVAIRPGTDLAPSSTPLAAPPERPMLSWTDLSHRPLPPPGERLAYGGDASQFGELRVPPGAGPFPVVMLIHGGCWLSDFDYAYMGHLAAAITAEGYATWNIEYRRLGDSGGGWPQTFTDVGAALDYLRDLSPSRPLDLGRIITVGHSAGGQLALWLGARPHLPSASPIRGHHPLAVHGAIGLAAITDMAEYRIGPADSCHSAVDPLLGGTPDSVPERYAQTSPLALLPIGIPQWLIQGQRDPIVSASSVTAYVQAGQHAGDAVRERPFDGGHFDAAAPEGPAWSALVQALREARD